MITGPSIPIVSKLLKVAIVLQEKFGVSPETEELLKKLIKLNNQKTLPDTLEYFSKN